VFHLFSRVGRVERIILCFHILIPKRHSGKFARHFADESPYIVLDLAYALSGLVCSINRSIQPTHWFSRFVVRWELDQTLELSFVLKAVDRALAQAQPTIWSSEQGSHFTSPAYLDRLHTAGVQISMDGRGRAMDNIFTEWLWRSVKYEEVYLNDYSCPRDAYQGIARYLQFYNFVRPHQALDYQTPSQSYVVKDRVML
jgi:hypothetical protein